MKITTKCVINNEDFYENLIKELCEKDTGNYKIFKIEKPISIFAERSELALCEDENDIIKLLEKKTFIRKTSINILELSDDDYNKMLSSKTSLKKFIINYFNKNNTDGCDIYLYKISLFEKKKKYFLKIRYCDAEKELRDCIIL